jgi:RND superfamily putative drug exporter
MTTVRDEQAGAADRAAEPVGPRPRWLVPALGIVVFLLAGAALGGFSGKLTDVQRNDSATFLPDRAEATQVLAASKRFTGMETTPAIVVYTRPSGITEADRIQITLVVLAIAEHLSPHLASPPAGPIVSDDGKAAEVIVPLIGSDPERIRPDVEWLRERAPDAPDLEVHVGGPAGALADLTDVFGAVNGLLLAVTGGLVLLILVLVYRSPLLPVVVLLVAVIALGIAGGVLYLLASARVLTVSGDAQGILDALVLGAGTDYALLLVARYREELRRHEDRYAAMRVAWRASLAPIAASGSTVILGLLCLLVSGLPSTRGLGPVAAIGIASALVSMLVLLPAVLVLLGRVAFWPFRPGFGSAPVEERGLWSAAARRIGRRARLVWVVTAVLLAGLAVGLTRLEAHGVPRTRSFLAAVDSNAAQDQLISHFPAAAGVPAIVVARADHLDDVLRAAAGVPGVAKVESYVDPLEAYDRKLAGQPPPGPKLVDGLARVEVTLDAGADSPRAVAVVRDLRRALHAVAGAEAKVGGYTASNVDIQDTAGHDRLVIIPLVLGVVLLVLMLLLRSVVAPLLLTATVILSFLATLGVCGVVFRDVVGFAGADASFPLFAFVFLVALGVDYNIFLMTRVREETRRLGHRAGTLTGLAVSGGVITSAGVVLAATFAALAVLPLVFLAELAFAVAFGVLLDTLVVRSLLVPALTVDAGRVVWWPGRLRRADP